MFLWLGPRNTKLALIIELHDRKFLWLELNHLGEVVFVWRPVSTQVIRHIQFPLLLGTTEIRQLLFCRMVIADKFPSHVDQIRLIIRKTKEVYFKDVLADLLHLGEKEDFSRTCRASKNSFMKQNEQDSKITPLILVWLLMCLIKENGLSSRVR